MKLHEYVLMLEEMNDKGEISDEEVLKEIDDIINNKNKDFQIDKTQSLEDFEKIIVDLKRRQDERKKSHTTSV